MQPSNVYDAVSLQYIWVCFMIYGNFAHEACTEQNHSAWEEATVYNIKVAEFQTNDALSAARKHTMHAPGAEVSAYSQQNTLVLCKKLYKDERCTSSHTSKRTLHYEACHLSIQCEVSATVAMLAGADSIQY